MVLPPPEPAIVADRLAFAGRRLDELRALAGGHLQHADPLERTQLLSEFFFHLVGAAEYTAQVANAQRPPAAPITKVDLPRVARRLEETDPLRAALLALYADTSRPFPSDPYGDDGLVYRVWNYRHHVTHRRFAGFLMRIGAEPEASLVLDPREHPGNGPNHSTLVATVDLQCMLEVMTTRSRAVLACL
jgi:hypothetical protein